MASYFKCFTKLVGRAREEVSFSLRPRKTPPAPEQGRVDGWISAACLVSAEAPKSADDLQLLPARSPSKPSRAPVLAAVWPLCPVGRGWVPGGPFMAQSVGRILVQRQRPGVARYGARGGSGQPWPVPCG